MSILDKAKIGSSVQVDLDLSRDKLDKEIIDAIKISSEATICDFRITDGKGIGVVLKLSNGKEQWFFEDEINILDENGDIIEVEKDMNDKNNAIFSILDNLNYENKNKINDLLNPINFISWLIFTLKDIL